VKYILFTFFIIGLTISGLSQQDTNTSSLGILLQQSKDKVKEEKKEARKAKYAVGGAINVAIGSGWNIDKQGFARGLGGNIHYGMHTINMYGSFASKSEEISSGFDWTPTLQSFNCGVMYGVGVYEKNISLSGGLGIGYTYTNMILFDPDHHIPQTGPNWGGISYVYTSVTYSKVTGCAGAQLTWHYKVIGFTVQSYINFSNTITNYVVMGGITFVFK
jgi:hypothetical protein